MFQIPDKAVFNKNRTLNCRGQLIGLDVPIVMGIINITPDSFYDGGKYTTNLEIIKQAEKLILQGARMIDLGAVSTRPGAEIVSIEEEEKRLVEPLKALVKEFPDFIFSIDTWRSQVAAKCIDNGAAIINDISGGTFDENMFGVIAKYNVPYVLMHTLDIPERMQINPYYKNIFKEIIDFFVKQTTWLKDMGVHDVIIDPGFGFGKTLEHNYALLKNLEYFHFLDYPLLVGFSRKSMLYKLLNSTPSEVLNATTIVNTIALLKGASILRVHDVKEAVEIIKILKKLNEAV